MLTEISKQSALAARELLDRARLSPGDVVVVGCSTSEIAGSRIGSASNPELAQAVLSGLMPVFTEAGIWLAAQCCEHLNRALIIERAAAEAHHFPLVNVLPQPKAGGSFATAAYAAFSSPAAVEWVQADAGLDIGDTLIGMHLKPVAVPVRVSVREIGQAHLVCARTRLKFVGGERAVYDKNLL